MNSTPQSEFRARRVRMVREQLRARGLSSEPILNAMRVVPRHRFVPSDLEESAYADRALPLGPQQTISQPFIVARMTELAADMDVRTSGRDRVLEVGTGSGYQAAVLAEVFGEVFSIELDQKLTESARARLEQMTYRNVQVRCGDGRSGWPDAAPFDAIVVTAGTAEAPQALMQQLRVGGRLVYPHGDPDRDQMLRISRRLDAGECAERNVRPVRFVPLRG